MRVHILGICGTFMGGVALLARELGFKVDGSDSNVYPPMSTQLEAQGITLHEGYDPAVLDPPPDLVVIGNALSRGNSAVEYVLDRGLRYVSGPDFLAQYILQGRWVLAVAGTHGKTTASSMLAWILDDAGLAPGFLIGGVPNDFGVSARLGTTPFFVVEADEYDSAFFDKRSKFVHYRPRTLLLNNLEYDHADIFPDLRSIQIQFHHLLRTVPGTGQIVAPTGDANLREVIAMGCWTPVTTFEAAGEGGAREGWHTRHSAPDTASFDICEGDRIEGRVVWPLLGFHNQHNAIGAVLAARHAGVPVESAIDSLCRFRGVKRRLELRAQINGVGVYDDFAHHPTAIASTLQGMRNSVGAERIIAVLEMRSNTMKLGVHKDTLAGSLRQADEVILYKAPELKWRVEDVAEQVGPHCRVFTEIGDIVACLVGIARAGDHVLIMSNGNFGGLHNRLIEGLKGDG
jgi:UDP-N-acetylmuramate: L-alanyl-gamma-D-glutamyl-meso-diaminopimelate ligase